MTLALLAATVVPLHFVPPIPHEARYRETMRNLSSVEGVAVQSDHVLDLNVKVTGRLNDLTAVDTTILRSKLTFSPNVAEYRRKDELERLAKGVVARAMVDPTGGIGQISVIKTTSWEKGSGRGATIAPLASLTLHTFSLPGKLTRVGDTWKATYEFKRALEFAGITAPDKSFPATFKLAEVRDLDGEPHARIHYDFTGATDAEKDGKHFAFTMHEIGDGWINVRTGFPRQIRAVSSIVTTGEYRMRTKRVIMLTAL